jgi:LysR family transcriptional activator of nhaA
MDWLNYHHLFYFWTVVRERYYAISAERRLTHPGVVAITSAARAALFG